MDSRLPRNRRTLWIGVAITLALHAVLLGYLIFSPNRIRVPPMLIYFTPKLELSEPQPAEKPLAPAATPAATD